MNDYPSDDLKRDIEAALSVEPSPDFVARVRRRVADTPRPELRFVPRIVVAALASAAVVAIAVLGFRPEPVEKGRSETVAVPEIVVESSTAASVPLSPPPEAASQSEPSSPVLAERQVQMLLNPVDDNAMPGVLVGIDLKLPGVPSLEVFAAQPITLEPLPEMSLNPVAKLEGITIEPLTLVWDNGVHNE